MIVSGTGSRELAKDFDKMNLVYSEIIKELKSKEKIDMIISGMAEGFDELLAKAAIELKLPLGCAIPNRGYLEYYWKNHSVQGIDRYRDAEKICRYAEKFGYVKYICKEVYVDGVHANFIRNFWMVNNCDFMLVYNPTSRGTSHCFDYIQKMNRDYKIIEV